MDTLLYSFALVFEQEARGGLVAQQARELRAPLGYRVRARARDRVRVGGRVRITVRDRFGLGIGLGSGLRLAARRVAPAVAGRSQPGLVRGRVRVRLAN